MKDLPVSPVQTYPVAVKQLRAELESCEKKLKLTDAKGDAGKNEANALFLEIMAKKERLRTIAAIPYEPAFDANGISKNALRAFFLLTDGFVWAQRFGWVGQSKTPTREEIDPFTISAMLYDGVRVERAVVEKVEVTKVTQLNMPSFGARGELPAAIGQLDQLESLHLTLNLLSGTLPTSLCQLHLVKHVDLSANLLTGSLSNVVLEGLEGLLTLNLSFNAFSGPLPDSFASMASLDKLDLSGNAFSGELPASIGSLSKLTELRLANNHFTGSIPSSFAGLTSLRHANLSQNDLTSGVNAFNSCARLERLLLQHNRLEGSLSASIAQLKRLRTLYLHRNRLGGQIPSELCQLSRLQHLNVSFNQLRGCLPESIGNLRQLETFLAEGNLLVGPVPLSIKYLTKLRDFYIFRAYPGEFSMPSRGFSKQYFERIYVVGPAAGINSMHWDFREVYGRERAVEDDQSVTIFSGTL